MGDLQSIFDFMSELALKIDNIRLPLLGFTSFSLWDFCVGLFATAVIITFLRMLFGLSTASGGLTGGVSRFGSSVEKRDRTLTSQTGLRRGQAVIDLKTGEVVRERRK